MPLWLPAGFSHSAETIVKRSRFLAIVARADDERAARAVIAEARATHPTARHHCSAFIVDVAGQLPAERSNDDGEPSGTAGAPMLAVLNAAELSRVVAVVTRYFGGVLLGAGGLTRAYAEAVVAALRNTPRVRPVLEDLLRVEVPPAEAGRLEGSLIARGETVVASDWGATVGLTLATRDRTRTEGILREARHGLVAIQHVGQRTAEVTAQAP